MEERRLLIAVLFSMIIVLAWQVLFPSPHPRKPIAVSDTYSISVTEANDSNITQIKQDTKLVSIVNDSFFVDSPSIESILNTDLFTVTLSETGGVISKLDFNKYLYTDSRFITHDVNLIYSKLSNAFFSIAMDVDDKSGLSTKKWNLVSADSSLNRKFALRPNIPELPQGLEIEKTFEFDSNSYGFNWIFRVNNLSNNEITLSTARYKDELYQTEREGSFLLHFGPGLGANNPDMRFSSQYIVSGMYGKDLKVQSAVVSKSWWHNIFGLPALPDGIEWSALSNRYFVIAIKPIEFTCDARFIQNHDGEINFWLILPPFTIAPNEHKEFRFRIFAGPKKTEILNRFDPMLEKLDGMEPSLLPKKISIARIMVSMLGWINSYIHNWGWSIILLTIIVRVILYPLSYYQFKSMARMQGLKPKIDAIQVKYAADKERLQRELMSVYKEAGVNPLGGCLPILLQMPILIGLFIALQNAIVLRGVPFILWINDLSVPDTIFHILGIPINPLPLALCITMYYQQKLTPTPSADPTQKQMMTMMPLIMTVLFYNFPSGLSLYWVIQNILSIGQQLVMMRKREVVDGKI